MPVSKSRSFSFRFYIVLASILTAIYSIIVIASFFIVGLMEPGILSIALLAILGIPVMAGFAWLVDRGSAGENTDSVIKSVGVWPAGFLGFALGGQIGGTFFGSILGIVLACTLALVGAVSAIWLASPLALILAEFLGEAKEERKERRSSRNK